MQNEVALFIRMPMLEIKQIGLEFSFSSQRNLKTRIKEEKRGLHLPVHLIFNEECDSSCEQNVISPHKKMHNEE